MAIKRVLITGDDLFLNRYQFLFKSLSNYFDSIDYLSPNQPPTSPILKTYSRVLNKLAFTFFPTWLSRFLTNEQTFIRTSQKLEGKIRQLKLMPDLVFHTFCMFNPFWDRFDIPYVMYLDYTMALAKKNWSAWSPFKNQQEFVAWLRCEKIAYDQARHIFTMSHLVKSSLVKDYKIASEKITVVGASGNFQNPYKGEKKFGSKQILINASEFERKGGDLVLAAFKQVREVLSEAKLVMIGKKLNINEDGVEIAGYISSRSKLQELFLATDLVVAPARCDPFPTFLMEAMNYGIPCIVSANDGMPEIIEHGLTGIVIEQLTPEIIADRIINLLGDLPTLKSMSEQARYKIATKLNWNSVAENILQVLVNLN